MSEPNKTDTQLPIISAPPLPSTYKMSIEETVKTMLTYDKNAENSLNELQKNIDNYTNQINEWKRIQLMIVGQRQLLKNLIEKAADMPSATSPTPEPSK